MSRFDTFLRENKISAYDAWGAPLTFPEWMDKVKKAYAIHRLRNIQEIKGVKQCH